MHEEYAKKNFFGCQIVENIPFTWVERWWNKIRKPPWCSEVLENFSHQKESHCTCSCKRQHAPFMMRALRPWTWWQRFVSLLSPLMRLSADPGHMLEFTGRWPPSCRLPYLIWDLLRSGWNPTQHHTKQAHTHTHTRNRLSFVVARSMALWAAACSLPQSDTNSSVELSCAFYWQTVMILLSSMKQHRGSQRPSRGFALLIHLTFRWSQWWFDAAVHGALI